MAPGSMMPMRGIFDTACCACAASGHAAAAAPRRIMNSRRLMSDIGLSRPGVTTSSRRTQAVGLPHAQPPAEWPASPWGRSELFCIEAIASDYDLDDLCERNV